MFQFRLVLICATAAALLSSCSDIFDLDNPPAFEFEKEYYISYDDTVTVFKSKNYIGIQFEEDAGREAVENFVNTFELKPVSRFEHEPYDNIPNHVLDSNSPIVFELTTGGDPEKFYSGAVFEDKPGESDVSSVIKYPSPVYSLSSGTGILVLCKK